MPYCWNSQDSFSFAFFAGIGLPISAHSLIALSSVQSRPRKFWTSLSSKTSGIMVMYLSFPARSNWGTASFETRCRFSGLAASLVIELPTDISFAISFSDWAARRPLQSFDSREERVREDRIHHVGSQRAPLANVMTTIGVMLERHGNLQTNKGGTFYPAARRQRNQCRSLQQRRERPRCRAA
jgi:hypothetical protein